MLESIQRGKPKMMKGLEGMACEEQLKITSFIF